MKFIGNLLLTLTTTFSVLAMAPTVARAQDGFDAYDPFADYSEFDEASDEEADIYFFKNGRFFTLGLIGGYRMFTDTLGQIYNPAPIFGVSLAYFFDLRFALQFSYVTGDHNFDFRVNGEPFSGTLTVAGYGFDVKYYLNVQNVTKGLSDVNPYVFGGLTQLSRTQKRDDVLGTTKDSATGFQAGVGTEFPMMKNKIHLGLEAMYQYVNFPGEGNKLIVGTAAGGTTTTNTTLSGDIIRFQAILGFNF